MLPSHRLWIGIPGPEVDPATARLLQEIRPGGVVLFRRNIQDPDQVRRLIERLKSLCDPGLLLSVDQEGGLVVRFPRELTVFPGNMALGAASVREPSLGEHLGEEQAFHAARELRDLGFDINLAPDLDLATNGGNPSTGIRSFGSTPELAARLGAALVAGTHRGGLQACLKHYPGLGDATVDSHLDLPVIEGSLQEPHLIPFRAGIAAGARLVMTSHVVYRELDASRPATLSAAVIAGGLREQLGFRGAVMTDDLEMGAMRRHFGFDETIRGAAAAGHDILCVCHDPELQRRAHRLVVEGTAEGRPGFDGLPRTASRLAALTPPPAAGAPDRARALAVAEAIAGRAVTVLGDGGRLPLPAGRRSLLAMPVLTGATGAENPLREEDGSDLPAALTERCVFRPLAASPSPEEIAGLVAEARGFDRLLVVLTNARFDPAQASFARAAAAGHPSPVFLPIRSPFDLEVLAAPGAVTAVVSYGFRPVQLRALARVLLGSVEPYGRLPVVLGDSSR